MQNQSPAITLSSRAHGESAYIVTLFSEEFGKVSGVVRGGKKNRAALEVGANVSFSLKRRLQSQLGSMQLELVKSPAALLFADHIRLQTLQYVCEILNYALEDEEPHPNLYAASLEFINNLNRPELWERLAFYELGLLTSLGYGLGLQEEDAVEGGEGTPLAYVSPKSGKVVRQAVGRPYHSKLFTLPELFGGLLPQQKTSKTLLKQQAVRQDFLDVFALTGHFLAKAVHGRKLPQREALMLLGDETCFEC